MGFRGRPCRNCPASEPRSNSGCLPYETARGNALSRYWNGHDYVLRDDLSLVHGNHLFQFGGTYTRWLLQHQRNDNGLNIITTPTSSSVPGEGIATPAAYIPRNCSVQGIRPVELALCADAGIRLRNTRILSPGWRSSAALWDSIKAASVVNNYNAHFSDTWKMTRTFTLTYGLAYEVQMPPYERNGNQPMVVDRDGNNFASLDYLALREKAALSALGINRSSDSPPCATSEQDVSIRSILSTPDSVLVSRLPGILRSRTACWQRFLAPAARSFAEAMPGSLAESTESISSRFRCKARESGRPSPASAPAAVGNASGLPVSDPTTAFRIGTDGMSAPLPAVDQVLAQPYFPGIDGNAPLGETWIMDSKLIPSAYRSVHFLDSTPDRIDDTTVSRIHRNDQPERAMARGVERSTIHDDAERPDLRHRIRERLSGHGLGQAVASSRSSKSAMGGAQSPYCRSFANCTAAVASQQSSDILNTNVRRLWSSLDNSQGWTLGRTSPARPLFKPREFPVRSVALLELQRSFRVSDHAGLASASRSGRISPSAARWETVGQLKRNHEHGHV